MNGIIYSGKAWVTYTLLLKIASWFLAFYFVLHFFFLDQWSLIHFKDWFSYNFIFPHCYSFFSDLVHIYEWIIRLCKKYHFRLFKMHTLYETLIGNHIFCEDWAQNGLHTTSGSWDMGFDLFNNRTIDYPLWCAIPTDFFCVPYIFEFSRSKCLQKVLLPKFLQKVTPTPFHRLVY